MAGQLDKRDFGHVAVSDTRGATEEIRIWIPSRGRSADSSRARLASASNRRGSQRSSWPAKPRPRYRFVESEPAQFGLPRDVTVTSAGAEIVHLQQLHNGVPVFQSGRTVHFRANGQASVTGAAVEALTEAESDPTLDARSAVIEAARYVAQGNDEETSADRRLRRLGRGHDRTPR